MRLADVKRAGFGGALALEWAQPHVHKGEIVQLRRPSARLGLLALAATLAAMLVAVPSAGAATFAGGPFKLDFKTLAKSHKLKVSTTGASSKTSTGGTFELGTGTLTMVAQSSGNIGVGAGTNSLTLTLGSKKAVLTKMTEKLTSGKGQLNAVVNGKGKAVTLFDQASQGKIKPAGRGMYELVEE
jgi:hypothetical protein